MFELNACCFCVSLRTGSLIIGYLNLIADVVLTVTSIMGISLGAALSTSTDEEKVQAGVTLAAINGVLLVFVLILTVFTVLLLIGLHQEKLTYVKAYLPYAVVFLFMYVIIFFIRLGLGETGALYIIGIITQIVLAVYFLLVLRSHYLVMEEPDVHIRFGITIVKDSPLYNLYKGMFQNNVRDDTHACA